MCGEEGRDCAWVGLGGGEERAEGGRTRKANKAALGICVREKAITNDREIDMLVVSVMCVHFWLTRNERRDGRREWGWKEDGNPLVSRSSGRHPRQTSTSH